MLPGEQDNKHLILAQDSNISHTANSFKASNDAPQGRQLGETACGWLPLINSPYPNISARISGGLTLVPKMTGDAGSTPYFRAYDAVPLYARGTNRLFAMPVTYQCVRKDFAAFPFSHEVGNDQKIQGEDLYVPSNGKTKSAQPESNRILRLLAHQAKRTQTLEASLKVSISYMITPNIHHYFLMV